MKKFLWLCSILLLFATTATAQTQSVPADIVARLRRQAQMTYVQTQIPHNEEYAAAVLSNGTVIYAMVSDRGGKFSLPLGIMLLIHTHPWDAPHVPSAADKATAKKIAAPNCVVTATEVQCVFPDGKIVPGKLSARQQSRLHFPFAPVTPKPWKFHLLCNSYDSNSFKHPTSIQPVGVIVSSAQACLEVVNQLDDLADWHIYDAAEKQWKDLMTKVGGTSQLAVTTRKKHITVIRVAVFTDRNLTGHYITPKHVLAHELGQLKCDCDDEWPAENYAAKHY